MTDEWPHLERWEHEPLWEWDNLAAMYRCTVRWPDDDTPCTWVDASPYGPPTYGVMHVRVVRRDG